MSLQSAVTEALNSYDLHPLQYLASVHVAILVCQAEDMQVIVATFRNPGYQGVAGIFSDDQWEQLTREGRKKLVQIGIPDPIIVIVLEVICNIGFEIFKWITYHVEETGIGCSSTFCWTARLTIDYVKTAENLIRSDAVDIKKRFRLACLYCLESEVRSLWRKMSLSERRFFFLRGNLEKTNQNPIILYWTYYIQEVPIDFWSCKALKVTELFKFSVMNGFLSATKFFLLKLAERRGNQMVLNSFRIYLRQYGHSLYIERDNLAIACFLVCQLPSSTEIIFSHAVSWVFRYFLEWPWQKHFMTVVNQVRPLIWEFTFVRLLLAIFEKEMEGFRDYDYKELFKEFWRQAPEESKEGAKQGVGSDILLRFVWQHFRFVFEEQSFTRKRRFRKIVFQQDAPENQRYFKQENVEFFKFLVLEQVATKPFIRRFAQNRSSQRAYYCLPLGELEFLIDGLLKTV